MNECYNNVVHCEKNKKLTQLKIAFVAFFDSTFRSALDSIFRVASTQKGQIALHFKLSKLF